MRLLLASAVRDSVNTGMGKWGHRVADALEERGHRVTLWFDRDVLGPAPGAFAKLLLYPIRLAWQIVQRRRDFDVVVVHEPSGFWYGLARRLNPSLPPLIAMCHNVESKCFQQRLRGSGYSRVPLGTRVKQPLFRTWQSDGTIRLADHVICLSTEDREYVMNVLGRSPEDVTIMVNGVAPEDFVETAPVRENSVLLVGGWLEVKGAKIAPRIFRRLRQEFAAARLTIAGAGRAEDSILADFDRQDREHVWVLPGPLDASVMRELYRTHTVFFMPSLTEGSPLSLLEAMAAGCAIVASKVGGIADIVRDLADGLLFELDGLEQAVSSLSRVLSDPAVAQNLGKAAQLRARTFSWSATAAEIERAVAAARAGLLA